MKTEMNQMSVQSRRGHIKGAEDGTASRYARYNLNKLERVSLSRLSVKAAWSALPALIDWLLHQQGSSG